MEREPVNQCEYLPKTHRVPNHIEVYEIYVIVCIKIWDRGETLFVEWKYFLSEEICAHIIKFKLELGLNF